MQFCPISAHPQLCISLFCSLCKFVHLLMNPWQGGMGWVIDVSGILFVLQNLSRGLLQFCTYFVFLMQFCHQFLPVTGCVDHYCAIYWSLVDDPWQGEVGVRDRRPGILFVPRNPSRIMQIWVTLCFLMQFCAISAHPWLCALYLFQFSARYYTSTLVCLVRNFECTT